MIQTGDHVALDDLPVDVGGGAPFDDVQSCVVVVFADDGSGLVSCDHHEVAGRIHPDRLVRVGLDG